MNKIWHEIRVGGVFKVGSQRFADDGKLTKANFKRLLYKCGGCSEDFQKIVETKSGFGALTI